MKSFPLTTFSALQDVNASGATELIMQLPANTVITSVTALGDRVVASGMVNCMDPRKEPRAFYLYRTYTDMIHKKQVRFLGTLVAEPEKALYHIFCD